MPGDVSNSPLNPENPGCDKDMLFGQIDTLIEHMNTNNIDAQQIIESFTNSAERISELVQAIPGIGVLPVDEIIDYAQSLWSDDLFEAYEATDTEGYRNQLKCDLFCLAQANDCNISIDLMRDYFGNRLGSAPQDNLTDIIAYLITGTWSGTEVNDLFYYAQATFMKYGNEFFGTVGLNGFQIYLKLATANTTWTVICDECPEVCTDPEFKIINPVGFSGDSFELTDNLNGTWTLVGTAAFDTNAYRLAFVEVNPSCCWKTISVDYSSTPENANTQYNCGAEPTDEDYGNGLGTGPLTPDLCAAGVVASDVDTAFTITWTFEVC